MMTCRELADFMADYLTGELPAVTRAEFDRHLAVCPSCVTYLKDYETAIRVGQRVLRDEDKDVPASVPEGLVKAILAARRPADSKP